MRGTSVLAAILLGMASVQPAAAADISKGTIAEILEDEGYNVKDHDQSKIFVDVGGYTVLVWVDGADADVSYITWLPGVSGNDVGYQFLNSFNNEVKFGRAYVDRDGDVAIQMDRNSAGGVSAENIKSDFDVFLVLISKFLTDLENEIVA